MKIKVPPKGPGRPASVATGGMEERDGAAAQVGGVRPTVSSRNRAYAGIMLIV